MSTREVYRKKALECFLASDGMANPEHRVAMLGLAQIWMRLANMGEEVSRIISSGSVHFDTRPRPRKTIIPARVIEFPHAVE